MKAVKEQGVHGITERDWSQNDEDTTQSSCGKYSDKSDSTIDDQVNTKADVNHGEEDSDQEVYTLNEIFRQSGNNKVSL